MTCKLLVVFSRDGTSTHRECVEYLEREWAPSIEGLPGLERVTTSIPLDSERIGGPLDAAASGYDMMAELQFDSVETLRAAVADGRRVPGNAERVVDPDECIVIGVADETLQFRSIPPEL